MGVAKCHGFLGLDFDSFGKKSKLLLSSDSHDTQNENNGS